jgi:lysozyme
MIPAALVQLIRESEGCKLTAYQDDGGVWTIGWGHTGLEVVAGLEWSQTQADNQLLPDIKTRAIRPLLEDMPGVADMPEECLTALADMYYNCRRTSLRDSTLRKRFLAKDYTAISGEITRWVRDAKGNIEPGLVARRKKDAALWKAGLATYAKQGPAG